jgi:hypothetical protein
MSLKEDPHFETVWSPESYADTTRSAVRFVPVLKDAVVMGYLWAAVTDDAADYVPREDADADGFNVSVEWVQRLRAAKTDGLGPLQLLRRWAGEPEDPEAGFIEPGSEQELPSLAALEELAQR